MPTLDTFTRPADPIRAEDLAADITAAVGSSVTVEITPTDVLVTGGSISEGNRTTIQGAMDAYVYIAKVPTLSNGLIPASEIATGTPDGTKFLRDDQVWAVPAGGGGGGVSTVSVVTANGVSGSVADATTTPAITLTLGAITPSSVASTGTVSGTNLSGTNTGDQTITLTGDVTGSGTGSFAATIAANAVTNAKAAQMATNTIKGNNTGSTANAIDLTATQATAMLNAVVGDSGSGGTKGLVPAPASGDAAASKFLKADGTWAVPAGGGSGSPGGSDTQIQFNDGGAFGGDADLTYNKTTNTLSLIGTDPSFILNGITTEPAAPSAGQLRLYSKSVAGRMIAKLVGPTGLDMPVQHGLWQSRITQWFPTNATAGLWTGINGATTSVGTFTAQAPQTTNLYTVCARSRYANVVTTANQILGVRSTNTPSFFLGNTANMGGFFFWCRAGFDVWTNGGRMFIGLSASVAGAVVSADPSSNNNTVGFCIDAADNGAISFLMRGTSATKTATGFTVTSSKGYDFFMYAKPNSTEVNYRIVELNGGTEASGTVSTNAPTANTMMAPSLHAGNAAITTVTAIQIGLIGLYIETDS